MNMADAWNQPSNSPLQATQPAGGAPHPEDGTPISLQVNLTCPTENMYFLGKQQH